ncbi:MAG: hypothetical protein U0232_34020, partial [Thermomicrobiales bacterium]
MACAPATGPAGGYTGGNRLIGNSIGVDITGTAALGNGAQQGQDGLYIASMERFTIADNVISGNGSSTYGSGLNINGCHTCSITGNRIGTNAAGTAAIPNALDGIYINDPSDVTIGGSAPGEGNLISGNGRHGIWHSAEGGGYATNDTHILGNRIGTDITGNGAIGNGGFGIFVYTGDYYAGQSVATIGGTAPGEGNIIANNALGGFGSGAVAPPYLDTGRGALARDLVRGNIIRGN